jgi:hypothetical protein
MTWGVSNFFECFQYYETKSKLKDLRWGWEAFEEDDLPEELQKFLEGL